MFTKAQYNKVYADITSNMLVDMGFENVVWSEDEKERVYVLENTPWRLQCGTGPCHRPHPENRLAGEGQILPYRRIG